MPEQKQLNKDYIKSLGRKKMKTVENKTIKGRDLDGKDVVFEKTLPFQLSLFQTFLPESDKFSNIIELYDFTPKYFSSPKKMQELRAKNGGRFLDTIERQYRFKNFDYTVEITPARIKRKNGEEIEYYPTAREFYLEEALKKIATNPDNGVFLNGLCGVKFTLYQLRKELKKIGREMNYPTLIESLTIAHKSNIKITSLSGDNVSFSSSLFPEMVITNREEWENNPTGAYCYIQFNALVTKSITNLTHRQFDYITFMKHKKALSAWLHKRIAYSFTNASLVGKPFNLLTSTIVRDSGLISYDAAIRKQVAEVEEALKELVNNRVLRDFSTEKKFAGRRLIDARHDMFPSHDFVDATINANKRYNLIKDNALKSGLSTITYNKDTGEHIVSVS